MLLTSCGGGGGGGSTVSPPPPPPPPQNTSFPNALSSSVDENGGNEYLRQSFKYNAPTDLLPSNLTLSGPDADFFEILIEASVPDANGDRSVTVIVERSVVPTIPLLNNFDNPQDSDKDNVYEFSFSATYQNRTVRSDVTVTILNLLDGAESGARAFLGPVNDFGFGAAFASISDITGDGLAEIAMASTFETDLAASYIIASETLAGPAGVESFTDTATHLVRFLGNGPADERNNKITSLENSDGSVDILLSVEADNQAVVYHVPSNDRANSFGVIKPRMWSTQLAIFWISTVSGHSIRRR